MDQWVSECFRTYFVEKLEALPIYCVPTLFLATVAAEKLFCSSTLAPGAKLSVDIGVSINSVTHRC